MRIEITIDADFSRTTVEHEFGLEVDAELRSADGATVARHETPNLSIVAQGIAQHAVEIHRLSRA